jgi:hypothetical protein
VTEVPWWARVNRVISHACFMTVITRWTRLTISQIHSAFFIQIRRPRTWLFYIIIRAVVTRPTQLGDGVRRTNVACWTQGAFTLTRSTCPRYHSAYGTHLWFNRTCVSNIDTMACNNDAMYITIISTMGKLQYYLTVYIMISFYYYIKKCPSLFIRSIKHV